MPMRARELIGPALLGVATGARTSLGLAGVAFGERRSWTPRPIEIAQSRGARLATAGMVAGELVADKLPGAPSRFAPQAIAARVVIGAVGGSALAWRDATSCPAGAAIGGLGALVGAAVGLRWRTAVKDRGWPDLPAALAEDAAALGGAYRAGRRPS